MDPIDIGLILDSKIALWLTSGVDWRRAIWQAERGVGSVLPVKKSVRVGAAFAVAVCSLSSILVLSSNSAAEVTGTGTSKQVVLPSTDNIWAAGLQSAPSGNLPQAVSVTPASVVTLGNATGTWSCNSPFGGPGNQQGPDGNGVTGLNCDPPLDWPAYGGLSGIKDGSRAQFITGVFLGLSGQPATPPARLDFTDGTGLGHSFASLSPKLGQVFFIGDGLTGTGSGTVQRFIAPAKAATLYLGYTDDPAAYPDNKGQVTATVHVVPSGMCIVPKVKGKTLAAAKKAIKKHHCSVGKITRVWSSLKNSGLVISQRPKPGKHLMSGAKVGLRVGK
jgi:hypothetical protein